MSVVMTRLEMDKLHLKQVIVKGNSSIDIMIASLGLKSEAPQITDESFPPQKGASIVDFELVPFTNTRHTYKAMDDIRDWDLCPSSCLRSLLHLIEHERDILRSPLPIVLATKIRRQRDMLFHIVLHEETIGLRWWGTEWQDDFMVLAMTTNRPILSL